MPEYNLSNFGETTDILDMSTRFNDLLGAWMFGDLIIVITYIIVWGASKKFKEAIAWGLASTMVGFLGIIMYYFGWVSWQMIALLVLNWLASVAFSGKKD